MTEIWLKLVCLCAQSPVVFSICETRTRPFIHAHTHKSCCFTNCSPHSISENFIYSLFVLRQLYCSGALWGEVICHSLPVLSPQPFSAGQLWYACICRTVMFLLCWKRVADWNKSGPLLSLWWIVLPQIQPARMSIFKIPHAADSTLN